MYNPLVRNRRLVSVERRMLGVQFGDVNEHFERSARNFRVVHLIGIFEQRQKFGQNAFRRVLGVAVDRRRCGNGRGGGASRRIVDEVAFAALRLVRRRCRRALGVYGDNRRRLESRRRSSASASPARSSLTLLFCIV